MSRRRLFARSRHGWECRPAPSLAPETLPLRPRTYPHFPAPRGTDDPVDARLLETALQFVGLIAVLAAAVGVTVIWTRSRRRATPRNANVVQRLDEVMARLSQLESAVDASAVEIERVAEGQRFTARILAERRSADAEPVQLNQSVS